MDAKVRTAIAAAALLALGAASAHAFGSKAKPMPGEQYHWYDNGEKKTLVLDPALLAEFPGSGAGAKSLALSVPMEKAGPPSGGAQLWRVGDSGSGHTKSLSARAASASGSAFSPVFRSDSGALRAPAGGVIVTFSQDRTRAQCEEWIATRKLNIGRTFDFGNIYVIDAPAGMASLELANELQETGEVLSASPNWWTQAETK